jgi:Ca2+-binding RTX toxin-like protein
MSKDVFSTTPVAVGDNIYVKSLLNAGWRWDTFNTTGNTNTIRWGIDGTGTTADRVTALAVAAQNAFQEWANVANLNIQFDQTPKNDEILLHIVPGNTVDFGGYSGTPIEAVNNASHLGLTTAELGRVHVYVSDGATGGAGLPVWSVDGTGNHTITDTGVELITHEIGHALGLKHPHDFGAGNYKFLFPGVDYQAPAPGAMPPVPEKFFPNDLGDNSLNQKLYTIMSYNEAAPPASLPAGGAPGGPIATPMAFDIAASQQIYGANTTYKNGNDTYTLPEPGAANGATWQCIWDTGGTDQIVYNGTANAVIDLRPATLDDSPTGGGMPSYTWTSTLSFGRGGTIAGDITNALPDQGGVTGVVIENAWGGSGSDRITGNAADNVLHGGAGNDLIYGLEGNDVINGDTGNDVMDGGAGNDKFIFELNFGADYVDSFDSDPTGGQDYLDIAETGVTQASFVYEVGIAQVGSDTQIHIGGNVIILTGVNMSTIDQSDFLFV